jgi:thiamine pyrophosphate-dependent acetolactate synthase large subunit-like protein
LDFSDFSGAHMSDDLKATGRYKLIEQMAADRLGYMFGNPGTVEQGFLDALTDFPGELDYVFALQESVAVGIADGYARARAALAADGKLDGPPAALVQLHTGVGLGNGMGMLYQAMRGGSPLVAIAGDSGVRYENLEGQMAADLVGMARPVTKWAGRVTEPANVLRMFRRAVKIASTPPYGPTFLALPADVLDQPCPEKVVPTSVPSTRVVPEQGLIERMADVLATAKSPLIVMGDGVSDSGASAALAALAGRIGAEVWGANSSHVNIPFNHPLFGGQLGHMFGESSRQVTAAADVVFIAGTYVFPEVYPVLDGAFADGAQVIHVDLDPYQVAKNYPANLSALADPRETAWALIRAVERRFAEKSELQQAAADRLSRKGRAIADRRRADAQQDHDSGQVSPTLARFTEELASLCPPEDLIVFDEALTNSPGLCRYLNPPPGQFFQTRGGSLGVGIPGAIGAKLARPDKTVFGFTGDGGSLYTIQALWTASHHPVNAKFVICNNHGYLLLKLNILQYWQDQLKLPKGTRIRYPSSFDFQNPAVDFVAIAQAFGLGAERVADPKQIGPAIKNALKHKGPYLIDLDLGQDAPSPSAVDLSKLAGKRDHPACGH